MKIDDVECGTLVVYSGCVYIVELWNKCKDEIIIKPSSPSKEFVKPIKVKSYQIEPYIRTMELTVEQIEEKLGHKIKIISKG